MRANKVLMSLVVGLGLVIAAGVILIGFGLYKKSSDPGFRFFAPPEAMGAQVALPPGAEIAHMAADGNRLFLHLREKDGGQTIVVLDLDSGAVIRRLSIGREP
ncbi:MAG: hypothetical protein QGF09_13755 [Rhodospirillales bacterium]|jgi:hypothetical protein|nr:hypothetical protein [Rhodospirillales bacterium]